MPCCQHNTAPLAASYDHLEVCLPNSRLLSVLIGMWSSIKITLPDKLFCWSGLLLLLFWDNNVFWSCGQNSCSCPITPWVCCCEVGYVSWVGIILLLSVILRCLIILFLFNILNWLRLGALFIKDVNIVKAKIKSYLILKWTMYKRKL